MKECIICKKLKEDVEFNKEHIMIQIKIKKLL